MEQNAVVVAGITEQGKGKPSAKGESSRLSEPNYALEVH